MSHNNLWIRTGHGTFISTTKLFRGFPKLIQGYELWLGHPLFNTSRLVAQAGDLDQLYTIAGKWSLQ